MKRALWPAAVACAGLVVAVSAGAPALKGERVPVKDWVVYLGCGEVGGPGTVVQLDHTGTVLGTVKLDGTPYGLTAVRGGLVAAVPGRRTGKVVRIDQAGQAETVLEDPATLPAPIAVTADPATGDVFVGDNVSDVLLVLPKGQAKDARRVLVFPGAPGHCQSLSLAFGKGGHLMYGGSAPAGVYRFRNEKDAALGDVVLGADAGVAADPASDRWVAALPDELRVLEADKATATLRYPAGRRRWHAAVAVAPGGVPVVALHVGGTKYEVARADVAAGEFQPLFQRDGDRVVCLAVGPRLPWKN
jgi:DNA-binding beta-propeller fold protein YncE